MTHNTIDKKKTNNDHQNKKPETNIIYVGT
jgi:hypothetical protein